MQPAHLLLAFVVAACATWFGAHVASRIGLVDAGDDARERKLQARAVPAVGGAAIALALVVSAICASDAFLAQRAWLGEGALVTLHHHTRAGPLAAALALAFCVGAIDDVAPRGLSAPWKLCGQTAAAVVLAWPALAQGEQAWLDASLLIVGAVGAQNALNTFDNADGAAGALALCGLAFCAPLAAAAVLGFVPFNLWIGTGARGSPEWTPRAYLGDSGSHLLGLLLFASPLGFAVLWLPLLDLARVAGVRIAHGDPVWRGDRRHLAHQLQRAGVSRTVVVLVLVALALPSLAGALQAERFGPIAAWTGCLLTAIGFAGVARATADSR